MKTIFLKVLIFFILCLALFANVKAAETWVKVSGGKWAPSPEILTDVRSQIESYVRGHAKAQGRELKRWQDYTFQYQAREEKGRKYIFVNALCGSTDRHTLDKQIIVILDGGSCFFNLKYDPLRKTFFDLFINTEA
jgi:hypothetical protein